MVQARKATSRGMNFMKLQTCFSLVKSDLYRYNGSRRFKDFIYHYLFTPGFRYSFWMRLCSFLVQSPVLRYGFFHVARLYLIHLQFKFGIEVSPKSVIGSGLYIGHFGGITVHQDTIIGKNCNISQGVTLGLSLRGKRKGTPVIGDNVYIGPGAKVIGAVCVGNDVAIGANCVVTKDVADHAVVVGVPGKVISMDGSAGYINWIDYPAL
jgi:serine O-acetyltransferase